MTRMAACLAVVIVTGLFALMPGLEIVAVVGLFIAGAVYVAVGDAAKIDQSVFSAAGAVAASFLILAITAWAALVVVPVALGWQLRFSGESLSYPVRALLVGPVGSMAAFTGIASILGGIGGLVAEMARDGVVCRAIQRARG